ncbi:MAG TPA: hypothetical protein VGC07_03315 [Granulicella sp.]
MPKFERVKPRVSGVLALLICLIWISSALHILTCILIGLKIESFVELIGGFLNAFSAYLLDQGESKGLSIAKGSLIFDTVYNFAQIGAINTKEAVVWGMASLAGTFYLYFSKRVRNIYETRESDGHAI